MKTSPSFLLCSYLLILVFALNPQIAGAEWESGFHSPGADENVRAMLVYGGELFIGGDFNRFNDLDAGGLVKWDGSTITAPFPDTHVDAADLVEWEGELYVASRRDVYRWDGSTLQEIGHIDIGGTIRSLEVWDDKLIVGGAFDEINGVTAHCVAAWGKKPPFWKPLAEGVGSRYESVIDLTVYEGDLVAVGFFDSDNLGNDLDGIARYDGSKWSSISGAQDVGYPLSKYAVVVHEGDLYVSFDSPFGTIEDQPANLLARWDGSQWHDEGQAFGNDPDALLSHPDGLIVGGFALYPSISSYSCFFYDGLDLTKIGGGTTGYPMTSAIYQDLWYFGGEMESFVSLGSSVFAGNLATLDGDIWQPLPFNQGNGVTMVIDAMAMVGDDLFVGGARLRFAGVLGVDHIARWDGQQWWPVAAWPSAYDNVFAMTSWNDCLVVSGFNEIHMLDQGVWQSLSTGCEIENPLAMCEFEGDLIIGADSGSTTPLPLAQRWDGNQWQDMGVRLTDAKIYSFQEYEGELIAAGEMMSRGNLCNWDGASWNTFHGGADSAVYSLTEFKGDLVIGGEFDLVGGSPIANVARWHSDSWLPVADGVNFNVTDLAATANWLVAAGCWPLMYYEAAFWDGSSPTWQSEYQLVGSSGYIGSLVSGPDGLFMGGYFTQVGDVWANSIVLWSDGVSGVELPFPSQGMALKHPYPNPFNPCTRLDFSLEKSGFARLEIFDVRGRMVLPLIARHLEAGPHHMQWDGCDASGRLVASGTYFACLMADGKTTTRKLTLVK